eukprot:TRINITY_DN2925_c0_g1_i1.p1 TRINITY_DN2925_c0_g1~~TRINITY_DN2925_c0_g1_i1.p1  ORF type:complete len:215 (-),score=32.73 TRINITY_DN2925_c0_g1_i1:63-707(-)
MNTNRPVQVYVYSMSSMHPILHSNSKLDNNRASENQHCLAFARDLSRAITDKGLQAWISTSSCTNNTNAIGLRVLEKDQQAVSDLVHSLGGIVRLRGTTSDHYSLVLPQEKYCSVGAASTRVQTWIEQSPVNIDQSVKALATSLAEQFYRNPEFDLVTLEVLADSKEPFFCIDVHNARGVSSPSQPRPATPRTPKKAFASPRTRKSTSAVAAAS